MNVTKKMTGMEHTRRVGFLIGVHLKIVLASWYWYLFVNQLVLLEGVIEVRKEIVYQNKYKSRS